MLAKVIILEDIIALKLKPVLRFSFTSPDYISMADILILFEKDKGGQY